LQYIQKAIIPVGTAVVVTPQDTNYILAGLALAAMAAGIILSKKINIRIIIFGLLWFFIFIIPGLLPGIFSGLEHRLYLPMAGLMIFAGELSVFKNIGDGRGVNIAAVSIIAIAFAFLTIQRLPDFENRFTFWSSAVEDSKHSATACLNLGEMYQQIGKSRRAAAALREGIARDGGMYMMNNNLGGAYMHIGRYDSARKYLRREMAHHPDNPFPLYNLGLIHQIHKRMDSAIYYYRKTLEVDRNFIYAKRQLKEIYSRRQKE
jgi:tetratricopeptide (TPR) repeat protein